MTRLFPSLGTTVLVVERMAAGVLAADLAVVPVFPLAQAALWAADLPDLKLCDSGIDEAGGCPTRPEHGGAGFLSTVFTWRYALNNLRAALVAVAATSGSGGASLPQGAAEATLNLLRAFDGLMEQPRLDYFGEITRSSRALFQSLRPFLTALPPLQQALPQAVPPLQHPSSSLRRRWSWPSSPHGSPLQQAAFTLRTGARMPAVGFGTWRLWAKDAYQPVRWALEVGYRHIDTAEGYANEAEIGRAIRDSGLPRTELFIATKASSVPKGLTEIAYTQAVFDMQLEQLGLDYVDVYMLHTPPQDLGQLHQIWSLLESLYDRGRARALGISNCDINELRYLLNVARVPPAYIQNLFKVYKPGEQMPSGQEDIVAFAQANGVAVVGYSVQTEWPHILPPLQDPHVLAIASRVKRTASQVLHRWALQRGVAVIPKASSRERILENAQLFDFELDEAAMRLLDGLATLSEAGANAPVRPLHEEDVYNLGTLADAAAVPIPEAMVSQISHGAGASGQLPKQEQGSPELIERTRDQGFTFVSIRDHLLGSAVDLPPSACQQRCLGEPRCAAWEVCAPVDPRAGCDGCYLIGATAALEPIRIEGWHAAVERAASGSR